MREHSWERKVCFSYICFFLLWALQLTIRVIAFLSSRRHHIFHSLFWPSQGGWVPTVLWLLLEERHVALLIPFATHPLPVFTVATGREGALQAFIVLLWQGSHHLELWCSVFRGIPTTFCEYVVFNSEDDRTGRLTLYKEDRLHTHSGKLSNTHWSFQDPLIICGSQRLWILLPST